MIDRVLIDIAKELNLKLSEDSVFGLYRGQLVSLEMDGSPQGSYSIIFGVQIENGPFAILSEKQKKKELHKKARSVRVETAQESIAFREIRCGVRAKTRRQKLLRVLDILCDEFSLIHTTKDVPPGDLILVGKTPVVKTAGTLGRIQLAQTQERLVVIHYAKGFWFSTIPVTLGTALLGHWGTHLKISGRAGVLLVFLVLAITSTVFRLYRYYAKQIDRTGKALIGASATIAYLVCWLVYFQFTITRFSDFDTPFGAGIWVALGAIWILTFLMKRTMGVPLNVQEGEILSEEKMNWFNLISKGNVYLGVFVAASGVFFGAMLIASAIALDHASYFSLLPFVGVAIIAQVLLLPCLKIIRQNDVAIDECLKACSFVRMPAWGDYLLSNVVLIFLSGALASMVSWLNVILDSDVIYKTKATLSQSYSNTIPICQLMHFETENMGDLSFRLCNPISYSLDKGVPVIVSYKRGAFRVPYAVSVSFSGASIVVDQPTTSIDYKNMSEIPCVRVERRERFEKETS